MQKGDDFLGVFERGDGLAGGVVGAEAAAEVQDVEAVAVALQLIGEGEDLEDGLNVGLRGEDGRAEVDVQAAELEVGVAVVGLEELLGAGEIDAELGLGLAGGGVLVGEGIDIRG